MVVLTKWIFTTCIWRVAGLICTIRKRYLPGFFGETFRLQLLEEIWEWALFTNISLPKVCFPRGPRSAWGWRVLGLISAHPLNISFVFFTLSIWSPNWPLCKLAGWKLLVRLVRNVVGILTILASLITVFKPSVSRMLLTTAHIICNHDYGFWVQHPNTGCHAGLMATEWSTSGIALNSSRLRLLSCTVAR